MAITYAGARPESKEFTLLPKGEYQFTVTECKQDTTKAGDDCLKVTLKHEGGTNVFDTLMFTDKTIWKFLQFVAACGQDPESGKFDEDDAISRTVTARVGIQKGTGDYKDRNQVEAYIFDNNEI